MSKRSNWRPYLEYLEKLHEQAKANGTPAADICDEAYWRAWRAKNGIQPEDPHDQSGLNLQEATRDEGDS